MLIRKNFVFYCEGGEIVCAERDVTQEGYLKQTRQSVMMGEGGGGEVDQKRQF